MKGLFASQLMTRDEARTNATLKTPLQKVLEPVTARYGGRIFKTTDDNALVEHPSTVELVRQ